MGLKGSFSWKNSKNVVFHRGDLETALSLLKTLKKFYFPWMTSKSVIFVLKTSKRYSVYGMLLRDIILIKGLKKMSTFNVRPPDFCLPVKGLLSMKEPQNS